MLFLFSRSQTALGARAVISLAALLLPLASSGCTESACFEWTEAEGTCPSQDEALIFFADPFCGASDIKAVDSDGEFDDGACCYEVSKRDNDDYYTCGGVTVGVGPSTAVSVGVGGAGGVGGSVGGAGGAGAGGAGGSGGSSECLLCGEAISEGDPALLCPDSDSGELYDAYMMCVCADVCAMKCADYCAGQMKTEECIDCESDTVGGCGNQLSACVNDVH